MPDNLPYFFWPQNIGPFERELRSLLPQLDVNENFAENMQVIKKHLRDLPKYPNTDGLRLRYRAFLMVLSDFLRYGSKVQNYQGRLYLWPPDWTKQVKGDNAIQEQKTVIRQSLQWERLAQLKKKAVRKFIRDMERERPFGLHMVSIRSLFANGELLEAKLSEIVNSNDVKTQEELIGNVIQPYLQLITKKGRCPYTNLRLHNIWRYLRYTWSIPYNATPGRNMFYLVRDANQPFHPVIGIAALGSSMVQLTVRDEVIGWTSEAIKRRIESDELSDEEAQNIVNMLRNTLEMALDDIATDDLVSNKELQSPTETTFNRLQKFFEDARAERIDLLQQRQNINNISSNQVLFQPGDLEEKTKRREKLTERAQKALFRSKRSHILRSLLIARCTLDNLTIPIDSKEGLQAVWKSSQGRYAIKTLVRENKKRKVGINMMDIIICGAIPPYNFLLGGKLAAMLLTSPQVVYDYKQKYKDYISNIASQMKGEPVYREPKLVFLGTTSLYPSASSQYNRVTIPVSEVSSEEKIRYIKYGLTKGYGSVHFSEDTIQCLDELQEHIKKARLINNRFGEGVNPKLRRVRAGISSIGLTVADEFLKHHSQRIVYGIPLGKAAYAFLRGETDEPQYFFEPSSKEKVEEATTYIKQYWAKRWLLMRINNPEILSMVASFKVEEVLLSNEIQDGVIVEQSQQQVMSI